MTRKDLLLIVLGLNLYNCAQSMTGVSKLPLQYAAKAAASGIAWGSVGALGGAFIGYAPAHLPADLIDEAFKTNVGDKIIAGSTIAVGTAGGLSMAMVGGALPVVNKNCIILNKQCERIGARSFVIAAAAFGTVQYLKHKKGKK